MRDLTDEQLVSLVMQRDANAFGEIVRRWDRRIFALCFGMLGREDDARDAAQEAFIAAFRNLENFRGEAKLSSWLHRIAVNQCLTIKRRTRYRSEDLIDDSDESTTNRFIADASYSPAAGSERSELNNAVRQAVGALPPDLRQVVVMKEFEEMTFQEIAETLELPLSTVKSRLYSALKQLRSRLERSPLEVV
jgi:RNA polymerase sigma-70 factor, ECF subfamily